MENGVKALKPAALRIVMRTREVEVVALGPLTGQWKMRMRGRYGGSSA
jgi:hypothetical protein